MSIKNIVTSQLSEITTYDASGNITGIVVESVTANTISSAGNILSPGNVSGANLNSSGNITATGNIAGGNVLTSGQVTATGNISGSNLLTPGQVTATGNVTSTGNVSGSNLLTPGQVLATGNVSGGNITTPGQVIATGNIISTGNVSGSNLITSGQVLSTGNISGGNFTTAGQVSATGNVSGGNVTTSGLIYAAGDISGANFNTAGTGNVGTLAVVGNATVGNNITVTGNATAANYSTAGKVTATGNVTGGNIVTAGVVTATGNVTGGNLVSAGDVDISGNVYANYVFASGNIVADGNVDALMVNAANVYGDAVTITSTAVNAGITLNTNGTGNIVLNSTYINGVLNPVQSQDAATKSYVDSVAVGLQYKVSSNVATTVGLPAYTYNNGTAGVGATITGNVNGVLTIDAVATTAGMRVLIKDETTTNAPYNGIYDVTVAGDAGNAYVLTRSSDDDTPADMYGAYTFIEAGTTNGSTSWTCTAVTATPVTIGSSDISWVQFARPSEYQAGNGLSLNGTVFNVNVDNDTTAISGANVIIKASANLVTPNIGHAVGNSLSLVGTGNISGGNLAIVGLATVGANLTSGNLSTGAVVATGNISGVNETLSGELTAAGTATAGNLVTGGLLSVAGKSTLSDSVSALTNLYVGPTANTASLTGPVIYAQGAANAYSQIGLQNINGNSSADLIAYANNGTDANGYVDMGVTGNTFNDTNYTVTAPNDGYLFVQGTVGSGGNLVLATGNEGNTHDIVFATGGFLAANEKLRLVNATNALQPSANLTLDIGSSTKYFNNVYANGAVYSANVTAQNFIGNGSQLTDMYGNANVASYLPTYTGNIGGNGMSNIAIGANSGSNTQFTNSVAIGTYAGEVGQGGGLFGAQAGYAIAIGSYAGQTKQGEYAVAVGAGAGGNSQSGRAIAIGDEAASNSQLNYAIAIGSHASQVDQGTEAIAIGYATGNSQGTAAIAIGSRASTGNQANNSVIINSTGNGITATNLGLYVAPVRNDTGNITNVVYYNAATKEITYAQSVVGYGNTNVVDLLSSGNVTSNVITTGNVSGSYFIGNGSQLTGMYGNVQVSDYLASGTANANVTTTANISGNYLLGNGTYLTNVVATTSIINGTSNARVYANGNVTLSAANVANVVTVTSNSLRVAGNIYDSTGQVYGTAASFAKYTRNTTQTGVAANTVIICNVVEALFGPDIFVDPANGNVTLQAGKTYRLRGQVGRAVSSGSAAAMAYQWYNVTTNTWVGQPASVVATAGGGNEAVNMGTAEYVVSPGVVSVFQLRSTNMTNTTSIAADSGISTYQVGAPFIDIQAIGGAVSVVGQSVYNNSFLSPIADATAIPTAPTTATTVLTYSIPSLGTWRLDASLCLQGPGGNGAYASWALFDASGIEVANSRNLAAFTNAATIMITQVSNNFIVTTSGPATYTVRAWGGPTSYIRNSATYGYTTGKITQIGTTAVSTTSFATKASAIAARGTDVTLGNFRVRWSASGNMNLQFSLVTGSSTLTCISINNNQTTINGAAVAAFNVTTTPASPIPTNIFGSVGDITTWIVTDFLTGLSWRVTGQVGPNGLGAGSNMVTIEQLV